MGVVREKENHYLNASKEGNFGSLGPMFFVHVFALYVGVGVSNPIPAFFRFPCFFSFTLFLAFLCVFPFCPGVLRVRQGGKSLFFFGVSSFFKQKKFGVVLPHLPVGKKNLRFCLVKLTKID